MATISYSKDSPVTAPVSLKGVADLLNTTANSNGVTTAKYDVGSVCTSGKVNMWAKYKPFSLYPSASSYETAVRNGTIGTISYDSVDPDNRKNVNYGLVVAGSSPMYYWSWNKPNTGKVDPARLGDFRGYMHDAKAPYSIKVKNILESALINVDDNPIVNVYSIKGFEYNNTNAADKTDFQLSTNSVGSYEYSTNLGTYSNIILCIHNNDENSYTFWNLDGTTNSVSFVLPLAPTNTPHDYSAVMLMATNKVTYSGDKGTTTAPTNYNPLLCKNNKFTLRMNRVTVWDNSTIIWSSLQMYLTDRQTNVPFATKSNGGTENWNYYLITDIKTTCNITFDEKYVRSFYMFLSGEIGFSGSTESTGITNNPFRIVKASVANANNGLEYCLKNNMWEGGLPFSSSDSQYYEKKTGVTSCNFTKSFKLSDNIYICVKTDYINTVNAYINEKLYGYSSTTKQSMYDCGEGSNYTKQIDFSKLTNGTKNSYITL